MTASSEQSNQGLESTGRRRVTSVTCRFLLFGRPCSIEKLPHVILTGRIAVASDSVVLILMLLGGIVFNLSLMGLATAAVLGGIVAVGSNSSTAKEASSDLSILEAKRAMLIGQLDLRTVPQREL